MARRRAFSHWFQASGRNLGNQRRIIIPGTGLVDMPRYRPHAKTILRGWLQKLCTSLAAQPRPDIRLVEHHRHTIVNWPRQLIRIRDDDRARDHGLPGLWVLPSIPQTGETQHISVRRADEIRLPTVQPLEPLVIAGGRDDSPMALERIAERGPVGNSLRSCVEASRQLLQGLLARISGGRCAYLAQLANLKSDCPGVDARNDAPKPASAPSARRGFRPVRTLTNGTAGLLPCVSRWVRWSQSLEGRHS